MKNNTSIISTLTNRSFRQNKGRNLAAVLAIFLTAMMFTTLFTLTQSLGKNMTEMYLRQSGTKAHASTKKITDEQIQLIAGHPDVVSSGWSIVAGIAENQRLAGRQLEIRYASGQYAKDVFAYPSVGKMPEGKDEIALDTLTLERLGVPLELGQSVTIEWRKDINSLEVTSSTFKLCGWWEGNAAVYAGMAWVSRDFVLEACSGCSVPEEGQSLGLRMMGITFSDSKDIEGKTAAVLSDCGLEDVEFSANLAYMPEVQQGIFRENLPMYGGMALVFLAGYLIIFNVFQISVTSDIQFYGRLKTLGMTNRQMKKMIYGQGRYLSLMGIPAGLLAGYLLGTGLVPTLLPVEGIDLTVSANPVIFVVSALFAYITVMISCFLPARMAGKVSPIEAVRYTGADTSIKKKSKKSVKGASLAGMAWANLWRSRKRTVLVICSLTLGLVLASYFYAKNVSFDVEKYLMDLTVADYEIDEAASDPSAGYHPSSHYITDELLADIEGLGAVEATGRLYFEKTELALSQSAISNLISFYNEERLEDFASYDPSFPVWKEGFDKAVKGDKSLYAVYGADGLILEAAASGNYILDGEFDREKFATGNYCIAIGPAIQPGSGAPTYSVGESLEISGRSFEVMAVVSPLQPLAEGMAESAFDLPLILDADVFKELWPDCGLSKFYFNVADEKMEEAGSLLTEYQKNSAPGMDIVSRQTMVEQYESQVRASSVMGYVISIVITLAGILNFINSMVTAIISRKREFAMIQSIGMTKRQLRRMLIFEGLYYAGITLLASYMAGAIAVGVIVRGMAAGGFSTFRFTLLPLVLSTPALTAFAVLIPYLCFKNLEKQSVVERLRAAD